MPPQHQSLAQPSSSQTSMSEPQNRDSGRDYYANGSAELATESALLLNKLSHRLTLTKVDKRLVIVLVGMPGRGKSFISRKLQNFLQWIGSDCKIFNVGKYRRQAAEGNCGADFFDTKNENAAALRQEVARLALEDMLNWIDEPFEKNGDDDYDLESDEQPIKGRVGIYDATNSTKSRRDWILEQCNDKIKRADKSTGVVFIESICNDAEIMQENLRTKVLNSPDYADVPFEEGMADILNRCKKYEEAYETIEDDDLSYIKIFNLSSKMMVNHIYGMLAKSVVPALMAWNMGTRPIYLCRASAEVAPMSTLQGKKSRRHTLVLSKQESLDDAGQTFSRHLHKFMKEECLNFKQRRGNEMGEGQAFPCYIVTSTIPRARETVAWNRMISTALSQLNPLDKGELTGKEISSIAEDASEWHAQYLADPFRTRYPGGESQADLMLRLEQVAICLEQQVEPSLVVSHTSVLQALVAYFRNSLAETCMNIDLPLNTVFKFEPAKGGGWKETRHCICSGESDTL
mmetsp:Transcript_35026/g.75643  ORF Transcript_35026/g.75643 Transcript_35026/m.75643 type:complete len:517 (+) Transcript_35026:21-1571(+)